MQRRLICLGCGQEDCRCGRNTVKDLILILILVGLIAAITVWAKR